MSISRTMYEALNKQFNEELNSAYIYDSMAAYLMGGNLAGFSSWMNMQASEERMHAEKIRSYLNEQNERVYYAALEKPKAEWSSTIEVFRDALKHEQHISNCIHKLVHLARSEKDLPAEMFLAWFVNEQVEEEANAQSVIDKLMLVGESNLGIYLLDKEIARRKVEEDQN